MDDQDWRDWYEERAAIIEFDGGVDRERAEVWARKNLKQAWERYYGTK
jgi:hypothetical protein